MREARRCGPPVPFHEMHPPVRAGTGHGNLPCRSIARGHEHRPAAGTHRLLSASSSKCQLGQAAVGAALLAFCPVATCRGPRQPAVPGGAEFNPATAQLTRHADGTAMRAGGGLATAHMSWEGPSSPPHRPSRCACPRSLLQLPGWGLVYGQRRCSCCPACTAIRVTSSWAAPSGPEQCLWCCPGARLAAI